MTTKINIMPTKIEIMSPAGSYEALAAAIKAGANSIYFGVEQLNMRARSANNFTVDDLKKIAAICRENNVKSYLALNTIMYDHDISLMKSICDAAKQSGISAIIAADMSAIGYANSISLEVHISTQANVSNIEALKFYAKFADVIVLARELTLQQIKKICDSIKQQEIRGPKGELIKIELFAHGAICVAISGKCYMSLATYNASANRGACLQNCRRSYKVIDNETGDELVIDNEYVMSPKDLCTIGFVDKLLEAGVSVLKIEGRGRAADYVYITTKAYREAVDCYLASTYSENKEDKEKKVSEWIKNLETVYNRGFWQGGYYLGKQLGEWSGVYGSKATKEKIFLGVARNYFSKSKIAHFFIESGSLEVGDEILITGPTTGVIQAKANSMMANEVAAKSAKKGDDITILVNEKVRVNDKLYLVKEKNAEEKNKDTRTSNEPLIQLS